MRVRDFRFPVKLGACCWAFLMEKNSCAPSKTSGFGGFRSNNDNAKGQIRQQRCKLLVDLTSNKRSSQKIQSSKDTKDSPIKSVCVGSFWIVNDFDFDSL